MRRRILALGLAGALGCTHAPPRPREPANVPTEGDLMNVAAQPYRDAVVEEAFLLGPPDANGQRVPTCWINPASRPELVPKFMKVSRHGRDLPFDLPACTDRQPADIAQIAAAGGSSKYAFVPALAIGAAGATLGAVCAIDFGLTAAVMAGVNAYSNRYVRRRDRVSTAGSNAGLGGSVVAAGTGLWGLATGAAAAPAAAVAGVITACTLAGGAVGYWLVPLKK